MNFIFFNGFSRSLKCLMFAFYIIIIENISLIVLQNYYDFDRSFINIDYALVVLILFRQKWLGRVMFLVLFFIDLITAITGHLRIGWATSLEALNFGFKAGVVAEMANVLDLSVILAVLCGGLAWVLAEKVRSQTNRPALAGAIIVVVILDVVISPNVLVKHAGTASAVNLAGSGLFRAWNEVAMDRRSFGPITASESAVDSAFRKPYARRILVVVIESWGQPANPHLEPYVLEALLTPEVRKRYEVKTGSVKFQNSTSGAELRELCGLKGAFAPSVDIGNHNCLPKELARAGYGTTALHGYVGSFYDRDIWYRRLGFDRRLFIGDLVKNYRFERRCGAAFKGLCDVDVGSVVRRELVAQPGSKQFIYWLTLSSHLPTAPVATRDSRYDCGHLVQAKASDMCNLFRSWDVVFSSLKASITQPGLPPTDVIIVGDHAPPFVKHSQTKWFDQERVPWVSLRPKVSAL